MVSAVAAIAVAVAALPACAPRSVSPSATLAPLVELGDLPTTTGATTTTLAPSSDPARPLVSVLSDGDCVFTDVQPGGEITFVSGDRLYGVSADGRGLRCLTTLTASQTGAVDWSPRGDRALLANSTTFDAQGKRENGYKANNTRIHWVFPSGDAMIAPTASNKTLVRRAAANPGDRTEVTFLSRTEQAVSHPSGTALIAAGTASDGSRGVFAADDSGHAVQALATLIDEAKSVAELAVDANGTDMYMIIASDTSFKVNHLNFSNLTVNEVTSEQAPIAELTAGPVKGAVAWQVGLCNAVTVTRVLDERVRQPVTVGMGTPIETLSVAPVGWLDAGRLVVAARPLGCEGPADVWVWDVLDGSATLVVKGVDFPALRTVAQASAALVINPSATPPVL